MFVLHKRTHQKTQEQTIDLSQFLVNDENNTVHTEDNGQEGSQYNPQETFVQNDQLSEPIILEESDMLFRSAISDYILDAYLKMSLSNERYVLCSMDQGANYFTTDSTFSVPIILSSDGLDSFESSAMPADTEPMKDDSNDVPHVLQSDMSQEQDISNVEKIDLSITDNPMTDSDAAINQSQNLKVRAMDVIRDRVALEFVRRSDKNI